MTVLEDRHARFLTSTRPRLDDLASVMVSEHGRARASRKSPAAGSDPGQPSDHQPRHNATVRAVCCPFAARGSIRGAEVSGGGASAPGDGSRDPR
jgi:hypothetical protein